MSGKGGVSKTRVSVLEALKNRSLWIGDFAHLQEECQRLSSALPHYHEISSAELLERLFKDYVKFEGIAKFLGKRKLLQNLLELAPNLDELLRMHRWLELSNEKDVVVDAPSTGNMVGMLLAIKTALKSFDSGALRKKAEELNLFFSSGKVEMWVVTLPENSSLAEAREIEKTCHEFFPQMPVRWILNRLHEPVLLPNLPEELRIFAVDRPLKENERIKDLKFQYRLFEGSTHL